MDGSAFIKLGDALKVIFFIVVAVSIAVGVGVGLLIAHC
jgi:hypothetical protein